jgi:hypothetical protein
MWDNKKPYYHCARNYDSRCDLINVPFVQQEQDWRGWEHVQADTPTVRVLASILMFCLGSGRIRILCKETRMGGGGEE